MAMTIGLFMILAAVLTLPFVVKKVEENLEAFLFTMGIIAVSITEQWSWSLAGEALVEPIRICVAVLAAGFLFLLAERPMHRAVQKALLALGPRLLAFLVVVVLGLLSSAITAIIAALVLVEVVSALSLDRRSEIRLVVLACFSIGMGAALTPIGEPLTTIAIGKLSGEPWHADFWFCARLLGPYVLPGILAFGALAALMVSGRGAAEGRLKEDHSEGPFEVLLRGGKTYLFVVALVLLGTGFKPLIDAYVSRIPAAGLFWINTISAILDNATLTAAEVGPTMGLAQIGAALLGLIVAGGMLIPGNIPNIVAAGKLKIKSSEWARLGVPVGLAAMAVYFGVLLAVGF
jgi:predicted cation transporter